MNRRHPSSFFLNNNYSNFKFILSLVVFIFLSISTQAQDYYWEKAVNFPDTEAGLEAVTDLQAADGVIRYNYQKYAYEDAFEFKRIESLINQDPSKPGNFYWTGSQGKWIIEDEQNTYHPNVYTLDPATRAVKTFCATMNYSYYGSIDKNNIVFFKNNYYTIGNDSSKRIFRKYNPYSCSWDEVSLPVSQYQLYSGYMNKLVSDGDNLYLICSGSRGDYQCIVTQDVTTWNNVPIPATLLNNDTYYDPKQYIVSDKRGWIALKMVESDKVTGQSMTRFFTLKNQAFHPLTMGGDQPRTQWTWDRFKLFDSGNLYAITAQFPGNPNELLRSTDKGESWTKITTANDMPIINDLIETRDGKVYIGTASGVYVLKKFKNTVPQGCSDLSFTPTILDQTICKKGAIDIVVSGGAAPYSIQINQENHSTSNKLHVDELEKGYYEINIEDHNGCRINADFYINEVINAPLQVIFSPRNVCLSDYHLNLTKGYPPYEIRWTENGEEKKQLVENPTSTNSKNVTMVIDKNLIYTFAVTDQSGCPAFSSPPQQGLSFKPELTYTGTPNCDSVEVKVSIPNSTYNQFKLIVKDENSTPILSPTWIGPEFTAKVLHNAYYSFEVRAPESGSCMTQVSFSKLFRRATLSSFVVTGQGCKGQIDQKGSVSLSLKDFQSPYQKMIWSDIGAVNLWNRSNLEVGIYTFEVPEETGCGIKKTFEITKEIPPTLPAIPFLCPEETFLVVPQTTDVINPTSFYIQDQYINNTFISNGEGIEVKANTSYSFYARNTTNGCYSEKVLLKVPGTDSKPKVPNSYYSFCNIGDELLLHSTSDNVYWYSSIDDALLGSGTQLDYTTLHSLEKIHLVMQNEAGTCRSDSTSILLQQSFITPPTLSSTWLNATEQVIKPVVDNAHSGLYTYAWYGDDTFIKYGDSLVIDLDQWNEIKVVASDIQGCTSEKSAGMIIAIPTSNQEQNNHSFIRLYPNPATDVIAIDMDQEFNQVSFALKDMNGRLLQVNSKLEKHNELTLITLPAGVYFLEIKLGDQMKVYKILKQ